MSAFAPEAVGVPQFGQRADPEADRRQYLCTVVRSSSVKGSAAMEFEVDYSGLYALRTDEFSR